MKPDTRGKNFKTGNFARDKVRGLFRNFVPVHAYSAIQEIPLDDLWARGKRLLLLDVDHTLVKWRHNEFSTEVTAWIDRAKTLGFDLCLVSNTRNTERLEFLAAKLDVAIVRGTFKPCRMMFRMAAIKFKRSHDETIMIGDQLMTDIWGANRSGIEAIWVHRMDGPEFIGTKVNRTIERVLQSVVYRALISPVDEQDAPNTKSPIWERAIVRQLLKFCIVGASSFVIDWLIRRYLMTSLMWNGELASLALGNHLLAEFPEVFGWASEPSRAATPFAVLVAATIATLNSFVWNRSWTFEVKGKEERAKQLRRVYLIAYVGLALNAFITTLIYNVHHSLFVSTAIASIFVAAWNFTGQRVYAFKAHKTEGQ